MQRTTLFGSPFLLGFEHLERLVERTAKAGGDGYPPYNIEETEAGLTITLAVAGFGTDELSITVEDNQLAIRGRQAQAAADGKTFLHRGIGSRQFLRSFVLADGIEVTAAALENGLLKIDLARPAVQPSVRVVQIKTGGLP